MTQDKRVRWSLTDLASYGGSDALYVLSAGQVASIQAAIAVMQWPTRWIDRPEQNQIDDYYSALADALMTPVDFCDEIADCLDAAIDDPTSPVNQPLRDLIEREIERYVPLIGDDGVLRQNDEVVADGGPVCDFDVLFGFVTGLMRFSFEAVRDALEVIESSTTLIESAGVVVSGIPVLETLPFDEVIEWVNLSVENTKQQYEAGFTQLYEDEVRCALFELACNDCELTMAQIARYFVAKTGQDLYDASLIFVLRRILEVELVDDVSVVNVFHALLWATIAGGTRFFGLENRWITKAVRALGNDPDPDWAILCDPCAPPIDCDVYNAVEGWKGWQAGTTGVTSPTMALVGGAWQPGRDNRNNNTRIELRRVIASGATVNSVEYTITNAPKAVLCDIIIDVNPGFPAEPPGPFLYFEQRTVAPNANNEIVVRFTPAVTVAEQNVSLSVRGFVSDDSWDATKYNLSEVKINCD